MHRHFIDYKNDYNLQAADCSIICETRFAPWNNNTLYQIDDVLFFRNDDIVKEQGERPYYGMAIYSRETFASRFTKKNNLYGVEITIVKFKNYSNLMVAGVYNSPRISLQNLYLAISNLIHLLEDSKYSIIMGDFNVNLLGHSQNKTILQRMFQQSGYQQHITEYTTDNRTLIDHIYSNLPLQTLLLVFLKHITVITKEFTLQLINMNLISKLLELNQLYKHIEIIYST